MLIDGQLVLWPLFNHCNLTWTVLEKNKISYIQSFHQCYPIFLSKMKKIKHERKCIYSFASDRADGLPFNWPNVQLPEPMEYDWISVLNFVLQLLLASRDVKNIYFI